MTAERHSSGELGSAAWEALGTRVVLRVTDPAALASARAAVERELDAIDRACSRFRPDSELSRVNDAGGRWVHVDPLLLQALELALRAAALTGGDVDPTVGRALQVAGYDRDWSLLQPPTNGPLGAPSVTFQLRCGWQAIEIDRASTSVRVPAPIRLDLGATAKAWAADRAAAAALARCGCGSLVSVGGDIATGGTPPAGGWRIRVTDDHRSDASAPGQTITIRSGGLATSSTAVRRWSHRGRTMHHIIDPATGAPALGPWRTVSAAAGDCADANIATTAALVKGEHAPAWLAAQALPSRLVDQRGEVLMLGGWPAEGAGQPAPSERSAGGGGFLAA